MTMDTKLNVMTDDEIERYIAELHRLGDAHEKHAKELERFGREKFGATFDEKPTPR